MHCQKYSNWYFFKNCTIRSNNIIYFTGSPPLTAVAAVHVHIIDSSSPLFELPVYDASIPENVEPFTPVIAVKAISPHAQKLIYSISGGDKSGEFALDFNTGK